MRMVCFAKGVTPTGDVSIIAVCGQGSCMQAKNLRCRCAFARIARACVLLVSERYASIIWWLYKCGGKPAEKGAFVARVQPGLGLGEDAHPGLHPGYKVPP